MSVDLLTPPNPPLPDSTGAWFELMEVPLYHFARRMVQSPEDAADLVQETFSRFAKNYADIDQPKPWLYRTLRNLCLNTIRTQNRLVPLGSSSEDDLSQDHSQPHQDALPDEQLERLERHCLLHRSLQTLPEIRRTVVELKYRDSFSYAEIADQTGLTVSHVGYLLSTTLRELADLLRNQGIES
ncbi:MAG: RNA polymerase sigma factor [Puniceicoccaceae bacterium]